MNELRRLYSQFLDFKIKNLAKDKKFWFGVKEAGFDEKKIKKEVEIYERESFFNFLKFLKDIFFIENALNLNRKWSTDQWVPYYYLTFLKKKEIISLKKNGKIKVLKKELLNFFPCSRNEEEIKTIIEKKLKTKLNLEAPSNFLFQTTIKPVYDQLPISTSSTLFLIKKILDYLPSYQKFLFIGDDDLVSIYLSLVEPKIESLVIDIDKELLGKIEEISEKLRLKIKTKKVDILEKKGLAEKFVGFLISPVYTFEGVKNFLNFGLNYLSKDGGYVFLNLADEAIGNRILFLEKFFFEKKLKIEEVIFGKIYYPWRLTHFEDEVMFKRLRKDFSKKTIEKSSLIGSSLWIFNYLPFELPEPKKQPLYAYL